MVIERPAEITIEDWEKTPSTTYHHQMLAGAIVNPDMETVIPLAPEPIIKQDGEQINDLANK
jgi:hypothetical protein